MPFGGTVYCCRGRESLEPCNGPCNGIRQVAIEECPECGDQGAHGIGAPRERPRGGEKNARMHVPLGKTGLAERHKVPPVLRDEHPPLVARPAQQLLIRSLAQVRVLHPAPLGNRTDVVSPLLQLLGDCRGLMFVEEQLHAVRSLLCRRSPDASASAASARFRSIHWSISAV